MLQHNEIAMIEKENLQEKREKELRTSMHELLNAFTAPEAYLIGEYCCFIIFC